MLLIAVTIFVLIEVKALAITFDKLGVPATTAKATAASTNAYSTRSWPDSSRLKFLTSSTKRMDYLLKIWVQSPVVAAPWVLGLWGREPVLKTLGIVRICLVSANVVPK